MTDISFLYVMICGFVSGLFIPAVASRFGKVLPADPGLVLAHLWHKPVPPKRKEGVRYVLWQYKWKKLKLFSLCWGLIMALLFACAYIYIGPTSIGWTAGFILIIGFLIAVDQQYFLLPDFFTIPLLFLGFGFAVSTGLISPVDSFYGAVFGYLLCTLSVWIMNFMFKRAEFGAGDVKMVTALGAWLGYTSLNITLLLSFIFFTVWAIIMRRRSGAFGPALGLAAVIMLFATYIK